ncbi:MAG: DUF5615 family PIN-like protein [Phycisphaeraceae bacterium]|nr:DUF5615 family PIN-like protein [Phycisphaeraceae bacterium]MBX3405458.1 DUF5615 family PIN-like protein [Phycisphaeraceae bacterium]
MPATFLIDANMPRDTIAVILASGHDALTLHDVGLRDAPDSDIAEHARQSGLIIITRDYDFADVRTYPPRDYPGIVVLQVPDTGTAPMISALVRELMLRSDVIDQLPGRLAIVEFGRVRLRDS